MRRKAHFLKGLAMQTSFSASQLNTYLATRRMHPDHFAEHEALTAAVGACSTIISGREGDVEPFMTAIHILHNPHLIDAPGAKLDSVQLLRACRGLLNVLPIDEVASESITIYADLLATQKSQGDYLPYVRVVANLYIASSALNEHDAQPIRQACAEAFASFRLSNIVTPEIEQAIDGRLSRETCIGLVKDLGFSPNNLQSLMKLKNLDSVLGR